MTKSCFQEESEITKDIGLSRRKDWKAVWSKMDQQFCF